MIPTNELRIGNWFMSNPTGLTDKNFTRFTDWKFSPNYLYDCSPIQLTPEILKKCGFKEKKLTFFSVFTNGKMSLRCVNNTFCYQLSNMRYIRIESVHKLQNLYFDIEEEELEINL